MAEMGEALLQQMIDEDLERAGRALHAVLVEGEFKESQDLVPLEIGRLQGTGIVYQPVIEDRSVTVTIGYGDTEQDDLGVIAIVQHERIDYNHPNGREAKYLEKPVLAGANTLMQRVQRKMRTI